MRLAILIAGLIVSLGAQSQEIYKWVDKDGVVHFADQPGAPDAQRIEITGSAPPSEDDSTAGASTYTREDYGPGDAADYNSISIASPANDQVFYGANVAIPVTASVDPFLRTGHEVAVFVDGGRTDQVRGLSGQLSGLSRGTHTLQIRVLDGGRELISSSPVTFHVRAPSIATPPTGPAVNLPQPGNPNRPRPTPLPANRGG